MLFVVRIVIPGHHIRNVVVTLSEQAHLVHTRKAHRTFDIFQLVFASFLGYFVEECFGNLDIINHIEPAKTHFFCALFEVVLVYDSSYTSYHFTFFVVSAVEESFGIFKHRVFGFIKRRHFVVDERRYPIRVVRV